MRNIPEIADSVRRGERISTDDALTLWYEAPLWLLGELATERKRRASGDKVFYNRNVHLEPSNICLFNCEFCSFRHREGDPDAWYMSLDEVEEAKLIIKRDVKSIKRIAKNGAYEDISFTKSGDEYTLSIGFKNYDPVALIID
jgi:2-iminoacetate synthase ThiH